ncbi:MAG: dTDP-4-dehydrorhamnose reductase [Pseudomonadota bacterium]|nr:dTDP-4-dehydrorhamnose reductase [Pseudomonadota bacterium]
MRLLLLGKNGQIGWELQRALAPLGELIAIDRGSAAPLCGDLLHPNLLAAAVRHVRPDVIVNAAGYTAVDRAEDEPELAMRVNAEAAAALAQAAAASGALLIHYSTDYVFDGSGTAPWTEGSPTAPLNVYGRSKLAGEEAIRASGCRHLLLRTSWIYASRGANFARTMLRLAAERERLEVIADQIGAPTGADLVADVTAHTIRTALPRPELDGTYHLVAGGETSRHGYARHVIDYARSFGLPLRTQPDSVVAIASEAMPTPALRPKNSRLSTQSLAERFALSLPPWQHGVDRMLNELLSQPGSAR